MIREIQGTVLSIEGDSLVVLVVGWGVLVHLASSEPFTVGAQVSLKTYLSIKQDGVDLYGFVDEAERKFFELLLTVSGVGPKTALSVLRRAPRESLEQAIAARDITYLTRVVGLGKKAAEKLAVELSEKIPGDGHTHGDTDGEVFDTLVALGYTEREARKALATIPKDIVEKDARLKAALSHS
ncbi:Holliday junction branch migration protein RuvA [Patescibacteria group bacterium]|nr:Holliday junction branch migration protein RuvA [Patescibacteria group bacterium]MBU2158610.1 Holliday junction branch migration protein RuvA [Patescibacteria group bacterium]MBU2220880.1 Holliday junction branch migration protein RuvA [Patescibacteria group bacterium]